MSWSDYDYISKVSYGSSLYYLADGEAREKIDALGTPTHFLGVTTTELEDGSTTNPIQVDGQPVTALGGDIAVYGSAEFIWCGSDWKQLGDTSSLGALAYKDAGYTASQTISGVHATGSTAGSISVTLSYTKTEIGDKQYQDYTPQGTVSVTLSQTPTSLKNLTYDNYTPKGTVTLSGSSEVADIENLTYSSYTPTGQVSVSLSNTNASATMSRSSYTPSGAVSGTVSVPNSATLSSSSNGIQISGSVSKGNVYITPVTSQFASNSFAVPGSLPSFTPSLVNVAMSGVTASVDGTMLMIGHATTLSILSSETEFDRGEFPTLSSKTAMTGATATMGAVSFSGAKYSVVLNKIAKDISATFSGTRDNDFGVSSVKYDKASVKSATFTGTTISDLKMVGGKYDRVSISSATFSGTPEAVKVSGATYSMATVQSSAFTGSVAKNFKFVGGTYSKASVQTATFNGGSMQASLGNISIGQQNVIFTAGTTGSYTYSASEGSVQLADAPHAVDGGSITIL